MGQFTLKRAMTALALFAPACAILATMLTRKPMGIPEGVELDLLAVILELLGPYAVATLTATGLAVLVNGSWRAACLGVAVLCALLLICWALYLWMLLSIF
jgi:hypothetical protein